MSESENPAIAAPTPKAEKPRTNEDWWPNQLDLSVLHEHTTKSNPMDPDFSYRRALQSLDVDALKRDIVEVLTTSQEWWPADYGHYGPLMIRLSWHAAGTYRIEDGRGGAGEGAQRFAPLNSWPDNGNLDKARRLLWPIKQKYGQKVSWADLLVLAGNVALESMGFTTFGFAFGREDVWEPDEVFWGSEDTWLGDERYSGDRELAGPLGAVQMGLIYVNPEGPNGTPDPLAAARHPRDVPAHGDERRGDRRADRRVATRSASATVPAIPPWSVPNPRAARSIIRGSVGRTRSAAARAATRSPVGLEGAWTPTPTQWDNSYFETLFGYEWELTKSPAGAHQWKPKGGAGADTVPDAHDRSVRHAPMMATTDLALRVDPTYEKIARRFREHPDELADAFARAWYKLLHRDMGPVTRLLGPWVPEPQPWQDPVPAVDHELIGESDIAALKSKVLDSGLSVSQLVTTAWAAAASFRGTDKRGGANGARLRLEPQRNWEVNEPAELAKVLQVLEGIQQSFEKQVSLADVVVLAGGAAIEKAATDAGFDVTVPFAPGRTDASQEQTDIESAAVLEPIADGFRNYARVGDKIPAEVRLLDKANLLTLSPPEMTALVGGMRVLGTNHRQSQHGVFTDRPGTLTNDFFVNLLATREWTASSSEEGVYENGAWTATAVDLVFGAHSQLRAIAEVYASDDGQEKFVRDFVNAWNKVMNLDRYDLT